MKKYRRLLQFGTFYRLESPFEGNVTAWMAVSPDKKEAVAGWYRTLSGANLAYTRLPLKGLDPEARYEVQVRKETEKPYGSFYGDELMNIGLITTDGTAGEVTDREQAPQDFDSRLFLLKAEE